MAVFKGEAYVSVGNATGDRYFYLTTRSSDPGFGNASDAPTWELNAGASVNLYFWEGTDGVGAPASPDGDGTDAVEIIVYYETGTGKVVRTLYSDTTTPASGLLTSFHATDDGTATGNPAIGTVRLYVRVAQTNEIADNYDINTDADGDAGAIRCNEVVPAGDFNHDGYPSGMTHAIGPAGTENVGITLTHATPFETRGHEHYRIDALDGAAVQAAGTEQDVTSTTTQQLFAVSVANFDDTAKTYGFRATPFGSAQLQPTSEGTMLWSRLIAGTGPITQNGDSIEEANEFDVDPRVTIQNLVANRALQNLLRTATLDFNVQNARAQNLTRSLDLTLVDSTPADVQTTSDTGPNYDLDRTLQAGDDASFDFVGKQWTFDVDEPGGEFTTVSANAYKVSNRLKFGSILATDNGVITVEVGSVGSGDDGKLGGIFSVAAFNRDSGESAVAISGAFLAYANDDPVATTSITAQIEDDVSTVENTQGFTTGAGGEVSFTYAIEQDDKATAANGKSVPTLSLKHVVMTDGANTTRDSLESWGVTQHFWVDAHDQRSATLSKDTWNTADPTDGQENATEEEVGYVILGNNPQLWVHVMGVRLDREIETYDGDPSAGSRAVEQRVITPSGSTHVNFLTDTGSTGWSDGTDADEDGVADGDPNADPEDPWVVDSGSLTPASPNWKHRAIVSFEGCGNDVEDFLNIISPLDSDKDIRAWVQPRNPTNVFPTAPMRLYVLCMEKSIAAGDTVATFQPVEPDTLPQVRGGIIDQSPDPDVVLDSIASRPADQEGQDLLNVVDDTATIDGALYYYDFNMPTNPANGTGINLWVTAQIGGSPIKVQVHPRLIGFNAFAKDELA